jgi:hypothetical protein
LTVNRKMFDKKEILPVRTVSDTGIYCSSDRVGTVYNKCSKILPPTSVHFATRVRTWRVSQNIDLPSRSRAVGRDNTGRPNQTTIQ